MKKNIISIYVLFIAFSAFSQTNITIDSTITYQTIDGWEAVSNPLEAETVREALLPHIDSLLNLAINDVGLTRLRYSLKSGIEDSVDYFTQLVNNEITYDEYKLTRYSKINDNSNPFDINLSGFQYSGFQDNLDNLIIPFKNKVEANGEDFYFNLCFVDFLDQSAFNHTSDPQEYAEFMMSAWLFMDSVYNFTPDGLEVILEPDNSALWNKTHIPPSIVAVGDRLSSLGYDPEIIAPSLKSLLGIPIYINEIANNTTAMNYLDVISFHRYGGNTDTLAQQEIVNLANQYGKKTSMLEYDKNGDVNELHYDLKYNNITAWTKYALMYKSNEKFAYVYVDATDPSNPVYDVCDQTKYLRQYFKFIRPGAVRIEASSSNAEINPVAFVNNWGNQVVVIKAEQGDSVRIHGLPPDEYGIKYTLGNYDWGGVAPNNYDVNIQNQTISHNEVLAFNMPDKGVATVYGLNEDVSSSLSEHDIGGVIHIYPNLSTDLINLENKSNVKINYQIISLRGEVLINGTVLAFKTKQINTSSLPVGLYIVKTPNKILKFLKSNR